MKEGSGTDIVNGIVAVHVKSTAQNSATRGARVTQPEKQQPTDMSLSKPVQVPADDSMPPPVPFSKPPGNDIQADPKSASSGTITDMIAAAKKRPILCTVINVPWANCSIGKLASDGGSRQRELHVNSHARRALRDDGFQPHKGTAITAVEIPWTETNWKKYVDAGHAEQTLPMPKTLRTTRSDWEGNATVGPRGVLQVGPECSMEHRLFVINDGCHRTATMHEMLKEGHRHCKKLCEAGILLYDMDPEDDKNQSLITSIVTNCEAHNDVDRDTLADKLSQVKNVRLIYFCLTSSFVFLSHTTPATHPPDV